MGDGREPGKISAEFDPETNVYRATVDWTVRSPSIAVVEMLASIREVDPLDLPPLCEAVDPDALDAIHDGQREARRHGDVSVTFSYLDHRVTVHSYGVIEALPPTADFEQDRADVDESHGEV